MAWEIDWEDRETIHIQGWVDKDELFDLYDELTHAVEYLEYPSKELSDLVKRIGYFLTTNKDLL